MHSHYQNLFIVGAIKDTDASSFRKSFVVAPEIIVVHLFRARHFEAPSANLAALRLVEPRHDVLYCAVFAGKRP